MASRGDAESTRAVEGSQREGESHPQQSSSSSRESHTRVEAVGQETLSRYLYDDGNQERLALGLPTRRETAAATIIDWEQKFAAANISGRSRGGGGESSQTQQGQRGSNTRRAGVDERESSQTQGPRGGLGNEAGKTKPDPPPVKPSKF